MKFLRRILSGMMVAALLSCLFSGAIMGTFAASSENIYYIEPQLGDGASISSSELSNLYVKGVLYKNGTFTFTQTKTLTFTVKLESGWSYCSEYSSVFKGDTGALVVTEGANSVTFKYTTSSGKSVPFSLLKNVAINTTPKELPKLYLDVAGSFENVSKDAWVDCDVRLTLGTKKYSSGDFVGAGQVKGRGQSSWAKDQKPYSINFEKKTSLLDIPATKKYAIISTFQDASLIRNLVMYSAAQNLKGIDYVVRAEPVEVYLNNKYNGIYTLCQRIRISENQVIEEEASPENVSGAYILEKTVTGKMYSINGKYVDQYFVAPYLGHPNGTGQLDTFVFKDPDEVNDAMIKYTSDIVDGVHDAIMSSSDTLYKQYIDVDSWVDFIIMEEVAKNVDGDLKTSTFFLIRSDSKKLEFTSLWDFDIAFGNATHNNDDKGRDENGNYVVISGTPNADSTSQFMTIQPSCPWFPALYKKASFKQALMERYTEYRYTIIEDLKSKIDYYSAYLFNAAEDDVVYHEPDDVREGVDDFKDWLTKRLQWLDKQWLLDADEVSPYSISVKVSGKGSVTSTDGSSEVTDGGCKDYAILPDDGYELSKVVFNGRDVTSDVKLGIYTTPFITKNSELVVTFAVDPDAVGNTSGKPDSSTSSTPNQNTVSKPDGSVSQTPSGNTSSKPDNTTGNTSGIVDSTETPSGGNTTDAPDGVTSQIPGGEGTDSTPSGDVYQIFVDMSVVNGTVSVSADSAAKGTLITVTATPDEGYMLNHITVDGTVISNNTFVMPARDVNISAEFSIVVSAEDNRQVLLAAMDMVSGAKLQAIANLSSKAISDSYNNAVSSADAMYANEEASPAALNSAAMELMRMFGIMCREDIKTEQLAVMIKVAELYNVPEEVINVAKAAQEDADIKAAWDSIVDAVITTPSAVLLESLTSVYTNEKAEDYTEASFAPFAASLESSKTALADTGATQSAIDIATAELSYNGRSLIKVSSTGKPGDTSSDYTGDDTVKTIVMIGSIVLVCVALGVGAFVIVRIIRRKKAAK